MSVTARPYTLADKPACLTLFDGNTPPFFDPSERAMFDGFLDAPKGVYLVLERGGTIVGCGGYVRDEEEGGPTARFTWGMVDRAIHGAGLGRLLTEERLARVRADGGFARIRLSTTPMIAPFFRHMGFDELDTVKDGYAPGMNQVNMVMGL